MCVWRHRQSKGPYGPLVRQRERGAVHREGTRAKGQICPSLLQIHLQYCTWYSIGFLFAVWSHPQILTAVWWAKILIHRDFATDGPISDLLFSHKISQLLTKTVARSSVLKRHRYRMLERKYGQQERDAREASYSNYGRARPAGPPRQRLWLEVRALEAHPSMYNEPAKIISRRMRRVPSSSL
jgi:hypothetical protein